MTNFIDKIQKQIDDTKYPSINYAFSTQEEKDRAASEYRHKIYVLEQITFRDEALDELGLLENPKGKLLFDKAWDLGHSNGLHEVFYYMQGLSELIA
jgi:hypothetical protein